MKKSGLHEQLADIELSIGCFQYQLESLNKNYKALCTEVLKSLDDNGDTQLSHTGSYKEALMMNKHQMYIDIQRLLQIAEEYELVLSLMEDRFQHIEGTVESLKYKIEKLTEQGG